LRKERAEPALPSIISEWREMDQGEVHVIGQFVLKLNESTDNGKVKVKVIKLIPGDVCAEFGSYARQDKIQLRFISVVDQAVLCENTFIGGGTTTLLSGPCRDLPEKYDVAAVYVKSVNIKDGWVHFELSK